MNMDPQNVGHSVAATTHDVLHSSVLHLRGRYSKVMNLLRSDVSQPPLQVSPPTVSTNKMSHAVSPLHFTNQMMPISQHPSWTCKRDGCSGQLTLIGNVRSQCIRVEDAVKRAQACRAQFSAFYWHGSMLSCSVCGDRPKSNKRRKMWQRLCVICGEPFAMNSFWKCHGGVTNKGETHPIDSRVAVHKRMMREWAQCQKTDVRVLSMLMRSSMEEFKWLTLASNGTIDPMTYPITSEALKKIPSSYLGIGQKGPSDYTTDGFSTIFPPPRQESHFLAPSRNNMAYPPVKKRRIMNSFPSHTAPPTQKPKGPSAMYPVFSSHDLLSVRRNGTSPIADPGLEEDDEKRVEVFKSPLNALADAASTS